MERYRLLLTMALVINLLGSVSGFFYYKYQLASSPMKFWAFVPDSPGSTLLFSLAVLLILLGRKKDFISFLASASVVKYGFWTMFVIAFYSDYFLSPANRGFYYLMFLLHFGMVVEPLFIAHTIEYKRYYAALSFLWLGLNDYFDYVLGMTPLASFGFPDINTVGMVTFASSIAICLGLYCCKYYKSRLEDIFIRLENI
jgi:uncharacterized membrane protein YpjA